MKKIVSVILVLSTVFAMVMPVSAKTLSNDGYVVIGTETTVLDDDTVLVQEIAMENTRSRIGFGGTPTVRVTDKFYWKNGGAYRGSMSIYAKFSSVVGENCCYVDSSDYVEDNVDMDFNVTSTNVEENKGVGTKYAKYTVQYATKHPMGHWNTPRTIYVKCTANQVSSSTGNHTFDYDV